MDFRKPFLYVALLGVIFMLWTSWVKENTPRVNTANENTQSQQQAKSNTVPFPDPTRLKQSTTHSAVKSNPAISAADKRFIHVKTDVLEVTIDTLGGTLVESYFPGYPKELHGKGPFQLLSRNSNEEYIAQSGLMGNDNKGPDSPNEQAQFSAEKSQFQMDSQQQLAVPLRWKNDQGITVTKHFRFERGSYVIKIEYHIENRSSKTWEGRIFSQLVRQKPETTSSLLGASSYVGAAFSAAAKPYEKISFKHMDRTPLNEQATDGWIAMLQHYFISAWIPEKQETHQFYSQKLTDNRYAIGSMGPALRVNPGSSHVAILSFYMGPKNLESLRAAAPHLELTIDYGWLWFISDAIFWVMKHIYQIVHNWGWAIVIVTVLIKLAFYRLSAKSYRSMAQMRKLQPRIQSLKERFGDDRQRFNQAILELYKKEKVNPFGGCLPILVQIPVFIALYWVLVESVQLRHAPFIAWIQDLSSRDPYFVLPILMGLTMFIQQRLSPAPPDPMQAKVLMWMPVFFTFLFLYFPSGLVLYWLVNNTLSIAQQWWMTRKIAPATSLKTL